jgi:hypothetical protein
LDNNKRNLAVICVDDSNKPEEIPEENWCSKGDLYHVTEISIMARQSGVLGYKLAEISLPKGCKYQKYLASRFKPATSEDLKFFEELKKLLEQNVDVDQYQLV